MEVRIWIGIDDQNRMTPRSRLPGQQGRQCGFTDSAFAAQCDFHNDVLTARPGGRKQNQILVFSEPPKPQHGEHGGSQ
jgi:hypothetical protein